MNTDIPLYRDRNLKIIFSVTLIVVMGVTSLSPAFPSISKALNISKEAVSLLITVFTLPGIFLSPLLGVLADRIGRKKILVPSLFLFGVCGSACAFTTNYNVMLTLRFFQGFGAASLGSLNLTIIGDIYTGERRIRAMGYNSTVLSIGAAIYPSLGGALAILGWNYPFLLSLLAIPVGLAVLGMLDNPEPKTDQHIFEYLKNAAKKMYNAQIMLIFAATLATFILLYGVLFAYFSFFLKETFNATPFSIGMLISSASIGTIIGSLNLGRLSRIFSSRKLIMTGFFLYTASIIWALQITNFYALALPVMLYGFANGINIPSTQTMLAHKIPMQYRGAFMSINSMVLRTGQTAGPIAAGILFALWGIWGVFYGAAIFAMLVFLILLLGLKD